MRSPPRARLSRIRSPDSAMLGATDLGCRWQGWSRVGLEVEQEQGELDATDAVGERVVELHDECGPLTADVLDQCEFPQRTGTVEGFGGRRTSDRHHDVRRVRTAPGAYR